MREILLILLLAICGCKRDNTIPETNENLSVETSRELSKDSKIFLGNRLFSEKTCITCHAPYKTKVGPSIVDIMTIYKRENASIQEFLRGNAKPIVDTTKSQVIIMQNNIDGFLRKVTDVELDAIATYMLHVDELHQKK